MALAIVVTLEKELPAPQAVYAKGKTGKALARESDRLGSAARRRSVEAITSMLSEDPKVVAQQLRDDGFDPDKMGVPAERWYPATDGLKTVRALIEHVTANLNDFKQPNPILRDLKAADILLTAAEEAGVKFHFSNAVL